MTACAAFVLLGARVAFGQLTAANDGPIVYGHHHLNVTSIEAHRKFWIDTLGGVSAKLGTSTVETIKFPNVLIVLTPRAPTGGTKGTTVNHIGFQVPNLRTTVDTLKAHGYPIVTRAELPAQYDVKDDIGLVPATGSSVAFVMGPDETKVELVENKEMRGSIALHHVHFAAPRNEDVEAMQAWYVKTFGATAGMRGTFPVANLPGVSLTFSPPTAPVIGTRGRALDHIGLEVRNLERFVKELESRGVKIDRGYTFAPLYQLGVAYLTDPWGTYIELNEGLTQVK